MNNTFLVGIGGAIGAMGRYLLSGYVLRLSAVPNFPLGTLGVNLLGCFVMGILCGFAEQLSLLSNETKLFLVTGVLGGFTTFSAFGYESIFLMREGRALMAFAYITLSVLGGIACVALGLRLVR